MNSDIRMVVCDLDGTIVRQDNTISDLTHLTIKQLLAQGIRFMPCTGRSYIDMRSAFPCDIQFSSILLNGAMYADSSGKPITITAMKQAQLQQVAHMLHAFDMPCMYFTVQGLYGNGNIAQLAKCIRTYYPEAIGSAYYVEPIHRINSMDELGREVLKIESMHEDIDKIHLLRSHIAQIPAIQVASSLPYNIEVTAKNTNKAMMLKKVMNHYGLEDRNILFFGDSANDLAVFTEFTNTVAVENAISQVKQLAKDHCASCERDGVASYLLEKGIVKQL